MRWTQAMMRQVAKEERADVGLNDFQSLDPRQIAAAHGIPVYPLSQLADSGAKPEAVEHFGKTKSSSWSAALVPFGSARIIIENDSHLPVRRRSNIAHELGHHLLEHDFSTVILGEDHKRQFSPEQEKQATFMAGELLIPLPAVERMAFAGWSNEQVANTFDVSEQFAQMQMYGQRVRAARAAKKFSSRR